MALSRWPSEQQDSDSHNDFNAPVDLRCLDYVSSFDANLSCPICQTPFIEPVQLECEHSFCEDCLQKSFDTDHTRDTKPCPMCRRPGSKVVHQPAPRYVTRLLDELLVYCPHREAGCRKELKRAEVQRHVDQYCDFTLVPCRRHGCHQSIPRKDVEGRCLHGDTECDYCKMTVIERHLEAHKENSCPDYLVDCPHCSASIHKKGLVIHVRDSCPEVTTSCPGLPYGCTFNGKRADTDAHSSACQIAAMTPFLSKQHESLEQQRRILESQQRKLQILEGGIASMQSLLYAAPSATSAVEISPLDMSTAQAPFETPIQHVLSMHENLRDELSRLEGALADHDAQSSMMFFKESQRNKEEMAHANAAINTMRAQLHWLLSSRLQQTQAQAQVHAQAHVQAQAQAQALNGTGTTTAGAAGGNGNGNGNGGGGLGVGPSSRRMSGQDTKL